MEITRENVENAIRSYEKMIQDVMSQGGFKEFEHLDFHRNNINILLSHFELSNVIKK